LRAPDRADLDAGGVPAVADALDAEGALLDDPLHPRPVPQVVGVGIQLLGREVGSAQLNRRAPYGQADMQHRHPMHQS
jgi:hypothetical protein